MNTKRDGHACFVDDATSSIYVLGGRDNLNSTEKWTFGQNSWQPSASMPVAVDDSSAVSSNGKTFVGYMAGGWTSQKFSGSNIILGLRRRDMTWIKLNKKMNIARKGHSLLNVPVNQVLGC